MQKTLAVYLALQRLFGFIGEGASFKDYARPEGRVFSMSAVSSVFFPAQAIAAVLVQQCRRDGVIEVAGDDLAFKLDVVLSVEADALLARLVDQTDRAELITRIVSRGGFQTLAGTSCCASCVAVAASERATARV